MTTAVCLSPPVVDNEIGPEPEEVLTVSTAAAVVVDPALLLTTAMNFAPSSVMLVAGVV